MPVAEIEQADAIVILGSNLRHEVPLLHQRVRKAAKRGAKIHVVNPVDFDFAFTVASSRIVPPAQLAQALAQVDLGDASNVALIVGGVAENGAHAAAIRAAANEFANAKNARLCRIPQGANALGLSRHGVLPAARDAQSMLRDPRAAYLVYGLEPGLDFADQHAALKALGSARVVAFSQFACQSTRRVGDVILPIGALPEIEATLGNLDGIAQATSAAGKLPGQARPGWRVLRALATELALPGFEFTDLAGLRAGIAPVAMQAASGQPVATGGGGLEVAVSQAIYRGDGVLRRSQALQAHPLTVGARVALNPADAAAAGLAAGAMAKLRNSVGAATLQVVIDDRGLRMDRIRLRRNRAAGRLGHGGGRRRMSNPLMTMLVEPLRDGLLSFGTIGMLVWIVLKILAIAMPVNVTVAFYVVWERKLIGWMHVRHGPMYIGKGILQAFADVFKLLFKEVVQPTVAHPFLFRLAPLIALVPALPAA